MKKVYEEPSVKKVEFEFNELIAASSCNPMLDPSFVEMSTSGCKE